MVLINARVDAFDAVDDQEIVVQRRRISRQGIRRKAVAERARTVDNASKRTSRPVS